MDKRDIIQVLVFIFYSILGFYAVITFFKTTNFLLCLLLASLVVIVSYIASVIIIDI